MQNNIHKIGNDHFIIFALDEQNYAIHISSVETVIRAVSLTRLPHAPKNLSGLLNMRGRIIPVLDLRAHFNMTARPMGINDRIIVCRRKNKPLAFAVDAISGVHRFSPDEIERPEDILPDGSSSALGVAKLEDQTVLVYDIDELFSKVIMEEWELHEHASVDS